MNDNLSEPKTNEGELIFRQDRNITGMGPAREKRRQLPPPPSISDPVRLSPREIIKRIARRIVESSVTTSEDGALIQAQELISDAAVTLEKRHGRKPKTMGKLAPFIKRP